MDVNKYLDKALEITGQFEGRGFDQVTGNFDNMGLSVGFLQWNYGMGSLQNKILKPYIQLYGAAALDALFPRPISQTASFTASQAVAFCKSYMLSGTSVKSDWKAAWTYFLSTPECLTLQRSACMEVGEQAANLCETWGLESERAFCFMFDIVTQNGSMKTVQKPVVTDSLVKAAVNFSKKNAALWSKLTLTTEQKVLLIAGHLRAKLSNSLWMQDVMDRKGTIACGTGTVHGAMRVFTFDVMETPPIQLPIPAHQEFQTPMDLDPKAPNFIESLLKMLNELWFKVYGETPTTNPTTGTLDPLKDVVTQIISKNAAIKEVALRRALAFRNHARVTKKSLIALVDFTIADSFPRYFLIDMQTYDSKSYKVAHGAKSDLNKDGFVDDTGLSNIEGSNKSSVGAMIYAEMYDSSKFAIACRIDGLETQLNGLVRQRAIVGHDSKYVNDTIGKPIGDSLGCFAMSLITANEVLPKVSGGTLLYAWDDSLEG